MKEKVIIDFTWTSPSNVSAILTVDKIIIKRTGINIIDPIILHFTLILIHRFFLKLVKMLSDWINKICLFEVFERAELERTDKDMGEIGTEETGEVEELINIKVADSKTSCSRPWGDLVLQ